MDGPVNEFIAVALTNASGKVDRLRQALLAVVGLRGRVLRSREGVVLVLYEVPAGTERHEAAEGLRRQLAAEIGDPTVSAGVGGFRRSVVGAYATALQAEQALLLGRPVVGDGRTTSFEELGPYSFILGQPMRDIRAFCQRVLGPLAGREDDEHEALLATLEVYIRSRNINVVARTLGLHRNTVRKRLLRIARVTGVDLTDADTRLALHMAILGRRALERLARIPGRPTGGDEPITDLAVSRILLGRAG